MSGHGKELYYRVPLLSGETAELWLPRVVLAADAKRMARFIDALAFADEPRASGRSVVGAPPEDLEQS